MIIIKEKWWLLFITCFYLISRILTASISFDQLDVVGYYLYLNDAPGSFPPPPTFLGVYYLAKPFLLLNVDPLKILIYFNIVFGLMFVLSSYYLIKKLSNQATAQLTCLILSVFPTIWIFGIIGMTDMIQAGLVMIIATLLLYSKNKPKLFYFAFVIWLFLLTVKMIHLLLLPLIIFELWQIRRQLSCRGLLLLLLPAVLTFIIIVKPLIADSQSSTYVSEQVLFNVFSGERWGIKFNPVNKPMSLIGHSAFVYLFISPSLINTIKELFHLNKLGAPFLLAGVGLIAFLITFFIIRYLKRNLRKIRINRFYLSFFLIFLLPYAGFFYIIAGPTLRYYLIFYPFFVLGFVYILLKKFPRLAKYLLVLSMIICVWASLKIALPIHLEKDVRTQAIEYIANQKISPLIIYSPPEAGRHLDIQPYFLLTQTPNLTQTMNQIESAQLQNQYVLLRKPLLIDFKDHQFEILAEFRRPEWILDSPLGNEGLVLIKVLKNLQSFTETI